MDPRSLSPIGCAIGCVWLAAVAGCSYDFDAPFEQTQPTGAGGSATTSSSSAGGASMEAEDCTNGVDDDQDQLIDCADADCGNHTCATAAPAGWDGPGVFQLDAAGGSAPSCDAALAAAVSGSAGDLSADDATCSCSCGQPAGGTCGLAPSTAFDGVACNQGIDDVITPAQANQCESFSASDPDGSVRGEVVPLDTPGSCAPSTVQATVPPAQFALDALLCTGARRGGGCAAKLCVAAPSGAFDRLCIAQRGDVACPRGPYGDKTLVFGGLDDTRGCSACACDPAAGEQCAGSTEIYAGSSCSAGNLAGLVQNDGVDCLPYTTLGPSNRYRYIPGAGPIGGSCAASGGQAEGTVTPTDPTTVCCLP